MAIVMFALSLSVCKIFAIVIKCQNFDLENEGPGGENLDLRRLTRIDFHKGDFF